MRSARRCETSALPQTLEYGPTGSLSPSEDTLLAPPLLTTPGFAAYSALADALDRVRGADSRQAASKATTRTPKSVFTTEALPPIRLVPPMTTAAMVDNSKPATGAAEKEGGQGEAGAGAFHKCWAPIWAAGARPASVKGGLAISVLR